jgi:hypothetical protein
MAHTSFRYACTTSCACKPFTGPSLPAHPIIQTCQPHPRSHKRAKPPTPNYTRTCPAPPHVLQSCTPPPPCSTPPVYMKAAAVPLSAGRHPAPCAGTGGCSPHPHPPKTTHTCAPLPALHPTCVHEGQQLLCSSQLIIAHHHVQGLLAAGPATQQRLKVGAGSSKHHT